jgi:hypothetical protein
MPTKTPSLLNIDRLRRAARDLLRSCRAGDMQAQKRFLSYIRLHQQRPFRLADALFVIAREHGFASWPRLLQEFRMQDAGCRSEHELTMTATDSFEPLPDAATQDDYSYRLSGRTDTIVGLARAGKLPELLTALQIPMRDIKTLSSELLANNLYSVLIDALLMGVASPYARMRFLVAQALDHFADARCVAALRNLMRDPVPRVRWAAIHSLQCDRCKMMALDTPDDTLDELIVMALNDPSIKVRRVAVYELTQRSVMPRVREALQQIALVEYDTVVQRHLRTARL